MKRKELKIEMLKVKSFSTMASNQIKAGEFNRQVDGGDSIMECPTGCIPGDYCQPENLFN